MKKLLISGFRPFGHHKVNCSELLAKALELSPPPGFEVNSIILPVTFSHSFELLQARIQEVNPHVIIAFGIAEGRHGLSLEKVAINQIDCKIPDNEGNFFKDKLISPDGDVAYFSSLPLATWREGNWSSPVSISYSAGTFVCNYLFYQLLRHYGASEMAIGFIHLPPALELPKEILETCYGMLEKLRTPPGVSSGGANIT